MLKRTGKLKKIVYTLILVFLFSLLFKVTLGTTSAQSPTPTTGSTSSCSNIPGCENLSCGDCESLYNSKDAEASKEIDSLSAQIKVMDNQIYLTEAKIEATKQQILDLTANIDTANKKISGLEKSLTELMGVLINRIIATYEAGTAPSFQVLLSSNNVSNLFIKLNYLKIAQVHDKQLIYNTEQAKIDYSNQKNIFEDEKQQIEALKKQLEDYSVQLDKQKADRQQLLTDTQNSDAVYKSLRNQAKAQLEGFQKFVTSQGGASILSNQTSCDDWGCYYNQRDSQWGNNSLNNTQYTIASDGCLVTSMAMIYTHFGHRSVNPLSINSNPSNFASYYPAYLSRTIVADGTSSTRISSEIDSELSSGRPVVVGVGGGPDHFIVLLSGSGGNYLMNDPFVPNGHKINFTDHYSLGSISEIDRISM